MAKLSVNINKVATLRNARGGDNPDVLQAALDCELYGAQGITVHPRPDERHIRRSDVFELAQTIRTELNIEGYPSEEFMDMVCRVRPTQVTLVPDSPEQLTSNTGWDTKRNQDFLTEIVSELKKAGIRSSIFINPDCSMADYARRAGADHVEFYTEPYAAGYANDRHSAITPYVECARHCRTLGLGINAGHDLSLENLHFFAQQLPALDEVSIGHALICDALRMGLQPTIQHYLNCLQTGR
jgi:pyridoxine 5'-phosphate synthase